MSTKLRNIVCRFYCNGNHLRFLTAFNISSLRNYSRRSLANNNEPLPDSISEKFVPFEDRKRVIRDINEEQWEQIEEDDNLKTSQRPSFERGKTGVLELPTLVELLRKEKALDICVISIPRELDYTDFMVIASTRNRRQLRGLATFVRKRVKMTSLKETDRLPRIEGISVEEDEEWVALDLGNLVLHIFTPEARQKYDLETLWSVGSKYDDLANTEDSEMVQLLNLFK